MYVRDLMTSDVVTVRADMPLKEVARLLLERRISGVPVVDEGGAVIGVVSEADFLRKEAGDPVHRRRLGLRWLVHDRHVEEDRHRLGAVTAGEAMTRPAVTIEPDRPLSEAARTMTEGRIKRLPVVQDGRLVGILTRTDVVRAYARTDDELFRAVSDAVRAVDGLRLVSVDEGVARLAGTVASQSLAGALFEVVRGIDGIVAVDNGDVSWLAGEEPEHVPGWTGTEPGMEPGSRAN
jgi:CBS domain-containing protein